MCHICDKSAEKIPLLSGRGTMAKSADRCRVEGCHIPMNMDFESKPHCTLGSCGNHEQDRPPRKET